MGKTINFDWEWKNGALSFQTSQKESTEQLLFVFEQILCFSYY